MIVAWHPEYHYHFEEKHTFPMEKYSLLKDYLLDHKIISQKQIHLPEEMSEEDILRLHCPEYWQRLKNLELSKSEVRKTGFPHNVSILRRERLLAQGTLDVSLYALKNKSLGFNIAGGTHHAFSHRAEGYCLLNDQAIAAKYLIDQGLCKRVLILDLDAHQGNGTAEACRPYENIFTFSMHAQRAYPTRKEKSDLDIEIPESASGQDYLNELTKSLRILEDTFSPDFIFYQAGVDILAKDKLGKLQVSLEECRQRERIVFEWAKKHNAPITTTMGGGYSEQIETILEAHKQTFEEAIKATRIINHVSTNS